jgi:hypothetical protein
MGVAGPSRTLSKGKSIMKRALTGIATVGILAVTVGVETANAQSYRRYGAARTYTPAALSTPKPRLGSPRGRSAHYSVCRPEQSGSHRRW